LPYKRGYARVGDTGFAVVEASAQYLDALAAFRRWLVVGGIVSLAMIVVLAAWLSRRMTGPLERLATAAERIGQGDLAKSVVVETRDEIGYLASRLDEMRAALRARDERMQMMLAGIAHEVRNPLAGMTLFAGILLDELDQRDERRGHVAKIAREIGYLERVVNDFLEYARRPKPELLDVSCDALLAEVAQLATTSDVAVESDSATGLVAHADRAQLRRALLNLAKNAVQAAAAEGYRGRGAVRLSARKRANELALSVWNRGKEISPAVCERLFQPFFTTREKGTGLGLAFVSEIAVDHGGRVEVASASGETTFTVVLPIAA